VPGSGGFIEGHSHMDHCCENKGEALARLRERQKGVLQVVLAINAVMFVAECTAGLLAHSTALLADSLDMLGDAFVYGLSLYALHRSVRWRAGAAFTKGLIMAAFGIGVVIEAGLKMMFGVVPEGAVMGIVGVLALAANVSCLALLMRHRGDDLNMRSTWLCSRNDVMANGGVLVAAAGVAITGAAWPDILIGLLIAGLFLFSACGVIRAALTELRTGVPTADGNAALPRLPSMSNPQ
jgi:cation diffusion facilitator family transporter